MLPVTEFPVLSRLAMVPSLRRYFRSGWAFLIPYLAAYLLYYWLKWPVNPAVSEGKVTVASESGMWIPPLLHVYWLFHIINAVLAAIAVRAWWRAQGEGERSPESGVGTQESDNGCQISDLGNRDSTPCTTLDALSTAQPDTPMAHGAIACKQAPTASRLPASPISRFAARFPLPGFPAFPLFGTRFSALLPWLLLALLFYLPGVYLEYPADPWEHYARINEWSALLAVGDHSAWAKSSYFFAYSLLGQIAPPTRQLFWLDFYYTGACMLLCWQYYRLARAVGLGERASFIFVLVQAVTYGNNAFGFYRYYGISSSIFAQLGAVALIRVAIEVARSKFQGIGAEFSQEQTEGTKGIPTRGRKWLSSLRFRLITLGSTQTETPPAHGGAAAQSQSVPSLTLNVLASAALCGACLLALIAFNHPQGIGIAGLGLLAVMVWRLIEWKRSMVFWMAAATIALSVAVILWWPRNPALDAAYRPAGWLADWYGFNVLNLHSLAGRQTIVILGFFGVVNVLAGLVLLRRNHLVAWLTITPLFSLCLPLFAIPFADVLAGSYGGENYILTFHRMLLAIPSGLAIVCFGEGIANRKQAQPALGSKLRVLSWARAAIRFPAFPLFRFAGLPLFRFLDFPIFGTYFPSFLVAFQLLLLSLAALLVVPANGPSYNRFWQALMIPPDDLRMRPAVSISESAAIHFHGLKQLALLTTPGVACILNAVSPRDYPHPDRAIGYPVAAPLSGVIATELSSRATIGPSDLSLTRDPLAADPAAWTTLAGSPPDFVTGIADFCASPTALQNPPGRLSYVFTAELIPIDATRNYRVEQSLRQTADTHALAYLAVAWYDQNGHLLVAVDPTPAGAGNPAGWISGAYSYFGLLGEPVPNSWTIYRKSFGSNQSAIIPPRAKFVRIGALLNFKEAPTAKIQLTNIRLWEKSKVELAADGAFLSDRHFMVVAPSSLMAWTPASLASQVSTHWPANQVAVDLAGGAELAAASRISGARLIDREQVIFELDESTRPTAVPDR